MLSWQLRSRQPRRRESAKRGGSRSGTAGWQRCRKRGWRMRRLGRRASAPPGRRSCLQVTRVGDVSPQSIHSRSVAMLRAELGAGGKSTGKRRKAGSGSKRA